MKPEIKVNEELPALVYIAGLGHSGSTLLSLLLDTSDVVFSAGELKLLQDYLTKPNPDRYVSGAPCTCGAKSLRECSIWHDILSCFEKSFGNDINHYESRVQRSQVLFYLFGNNYYPADAELLRCISSITKAKFVLDSSKSLNRLIRLRRAPIRIKVIHLIRDLDGLSQSYRRIGYKTMRCYSMWLLNNVILACVRFLTIRDKTIKWLNVSYDSLAQYPEIELKKICKFMGLRYSRDMLEFHKMKSHDIGGNPMRMNKKPIFYHVPSSHLKSKFLKYVRTLLSPLNKLLVGKW